MRRARARDEVALRTHLQPTPVAVLPPFLAATDQLAGEEAVLDWLGRATPSFDQLFELLAEDAPPAK